MRAHSKVCGVVLRPRLTAAKTQAPTYYQTDTHWNSFGAFVAYQQLISALHLPDLKPLGLESFTRTPAWSPGKDLAICLQQELEMPETQGITFQPRAPLAPLKQTYPHDRKVRCIMTQNPEKTGKSRHVLRDSFADAWIPFVGYHFNSGHLL